MTTYIDVTVELLMDCRDDLSQEGGMERFVSRDLDVVQQNG